MIETLIFAILAHWIVTQYIVESEIARPFREWVGGKHQTIVCPKTYFDVTLTIDDCWPSSEWSHPKLKYLVTCRMCTGFWVAVGLGASLGFSPVKTLAVAATSHWLFIAQRIAERLAK